MLKNSHHISPEEVISKLGSNIRSGLSSEEARMRLEKFGENRLKRAKPKSVWRIFLEQFLDPVIYILGAAMILAFVFQDWLEGFAVMVVILITALIGFYMEWQALRSVEALQKLVQNLAQVVRDGKETYLNVFYVVPGDVIILEAGDVVPADSRVVESQSLALKESILTGESNQVEKTVEQLPEDTPLADQANMVFKGTIVTRGSGKAVVTATGDHSNIGQISSLTREADKESTPLEKKLSKLSQWLIWLTLILAGLIAVSGYLQGKDLILMVKTGIALAVAAIPEGLPIVATISLARGMLKLSRRKVVIKKLEAVQTLGETGIICTDKTGTLTENRMSVHNLVFADREVNLGETNDGNLPEDILESKAFLKFIHVGVLCNNSKVTEEKMNGDAIEIALLEYAKSENFKIDRIREKHPKLVEIPFDAEHKRMATLNKDEEGFMVCVKGALESLLDSCEFELREDGVKPFTNKEYWQKKADEIAGEGMRVLAFAYRITKEKPDFDSLIEDLVFIGITGFLDPPRIDIRAAIETYNDAGIKVVMITGDHPDTARKIGEEIGMLKEKNGESLVIHGKDLKDLSKLSAERTKQLLEAGIFARMTPKQKLDLVGFYQKNNAIVGMLGDGVNDAPALKKADIGIAMGIRGTEAAKEVADVILMDDKFTSTELAIRQGRTIFGNIRQFVVYLLSCNLAEIISVAAASISNLPLPLLPLQILFLNLVTDVFPALALGMGKGEKGVMEQPPRNPKEPIVTKKLWRSTVIYGIGITASVIGISIYAERQLGLPEVEVNNMAFYTLILGQLLNVFNLPARNESFIKNEVTGNPWVWAAIAFSLAVIVLAYNIPVMREVLSLVPLSLNEIFLVALFGLGGLLLIQLIKRLGGTV